MALPKIVQKLFSDEGKGSKLRPDIVPITMNGNSPDSEGNFTPNQTGCLPLSGGTMTGNITFSYAIGNAYMEYQGTNGNFAISGAPWDKGSRISLFGEGDANNGGKFLIGAIASGKSAWLEGNPNGNLYWNGHNVITGAGGTLSGPLKFSNEYISRTTKTGTLNISGGNSWRDGGYFEAYGPQNNDGMVMLVANNGTTSKHLKVTVSGLTYDGNNVITSAGGKITGTLYQDGSVRKSTNNSNYVVMGGSDWGYGAYLQLNGSEASGASDFCLASRLNGKHIELRGKNDGTLTWDGHHVLQYLNPSLFTDAPTDGTVYTIPWDCYGFFECTRDATGSGTMLINVNGKNVTALTSDDFSNPKLSLPLKKGQKLQITSDGRLTGMWVKLVAIGG